MKPYHKNPRKISDRQREQLKRWLAELGDLSGIVHNLPTDEIIGGNQRSRVFNINDCEIHLTETNQEPDEQGTIAHGFVIWRGHKYAYRQVQWTDEQCEAANVVANQAGGDWDIEILLNQFERDGLLDYGFEAVDLDAMAAELYTEVKEKSSGVEAVNDPYAEWEGMPDYEQENVINNKIAVYFPDNKARDLLSEIIDQPINEKTKYIWFPKEAKVSRQGIDKFVVENE